MPEVVSFLQVTAAGEPDSPLTSEARRLLQAVGAKVPELVEDETPEPPRPR